MIGIDTNILLRLWLNDEPVQNKRFDALLAEHGGTPGSLLVTDVFLAEAVWTLRSAFDQVKADQLLAIRSLLNATAFAFEPLIELSQQRVPLLACANCAEHRKVSAKAW